MDRQAAEAALERVRDTQSAFWDALRELEGELGRDLDDEEGADFTDMTLDDLLESAGDDDTEGDDVQARD